VAGGKAVASKVIVSSMAASSMAWRRVPAPASAVLVTVRVAAWASCWKKKQMTENIMVTMLFEDIFMGFLQVSDLINGHIK
jgi:hypothetical protein